MSAPTTWPVAAASFDALPAVMGGRSAGRAGCLGAALHVHAVAPGGRGFLQAGQVRGFTAPPTSAPRPARAEGLEERVEREAHHLHLALGVHADLGVVRRREAGVVLAVEVAEEEQPLVRRADEA